MIANAKTTSKARKSQVTKTTYLRVIDALSGVTLSIQPTMQHVTDKYKALIKVGGVHIVPFTVNQGNKVQLCEEFNEILLGITRRAAKPTDNRLGGDLDW